MMVYDAKTTITVNLFIVMISEKMNYEQFYKIPQNDQQYNKTDCQNYDTFT